MHTFGNTLPSGLKVLKLTGTKLRAKLVSHMFNHKTSLKSKISMAFLLFQKRHYFANSWLGRIASVR